MAGRRLLILGEGFSHDAHYGKTMRGIVRYGPDPVVAILDSRRTGEEHEGILSKSRRPVHYRRKEKKHNRS